MGQISTTITTVRIILILQLYFFFFFLKLESPKSNIYFILEIQTFHHKFELSTIFRSLDIVSILIFTGTRAGKKLFPDIFKPDKQKEKFRVNSILLPARQAVK